MPDHRATGLTGDLSNLRPGRLVLRCRHGPALQPEPSGAPPREAMRLRVRVIDGRRMHVEQGQREARPQRCSEWSPGAVPRWSVRPALIRDPWAVGRPSSRIWSPNAAASPRANPPRTPAGRTRSNPAVRTTAPSVRCRGRWSSRSRRPCHHLGQAFDAGRRAVEALRVVHAARVRPHPGNQPGKSHPPVRTLTAFAIAIASGQAPSLGDEVRPTAGGSHA